MPCRPSPRSLRQVSLDAVARNYEAICYGAAKGTKELHRLIETDAITQYDSPFEEWPSALLADLSDAIYRVVKNNLRRKSWGTSWNHPITVVDRDRSTSCTTSSSRR